jgi:hypothetical protein
MDFIGTASSSQLLFLMAIPLIGAVLLTAFIVFALARRGKKPGMKLGIPPKPSKHEDTAPVVNKTDPEPLLGQVLNAVSSHPQPPSFDNLDLGPLVNKPIRETTMKETSKPTVQPKGRLMSRLEQQPSALSQQDRTVELLRLLRDSRSGQLIVEIGGQRYSKLADITDKEIGQYILKLAAHLLAFTNGVIMTAAGMKSLPVSKVGDLPEPIVDTPALPPPIQASPASPPPVEPQPEPAKAPPEVEAAFLASLRSSSPSAEPPKRGGLLGLGRAPQPAPTLPQLNLAEEINDIVQARLRYSPLAESHHVEISSDLHGGIRFKVNGQYYGSLDDIPDSAIKDLIRASIKEWERR